MEYQFRGAKPRSKCASMCPGCCDSEYEMRSCVSPKTTDFEATGGDPMLPRLIPLRTTSPRAPLPPAPSDKHSPPEHNRIPATPAGTSAESAPVYLPSPATLETPASPLH